MKILPDRENILIESLYIIRNLNCYPAEDGKYFSRPLGFLLLALLFFQILVSLIGVVNVLFTDFYYLPEDLFENILCITVGPCLLYPFIYFNAHPHLLQRVALASSQFGKFGAPPGVDHLVEITRKLKIVCYAYCGIGSFIYTMTGVLEMGKCRRQLQEHPALIKSCATPLANLFDFPINGWYLVVFNGVVFLSLCLMTMIATGAALCFTVPYEFMVLRVKDFINELRKLDSKNTAEEVRVHFHYCVEYHQIICNLYRTLNTEISRPYTFYLFAFSIVLSILGYQVLFYFSIKAVIHLFGWIVACLIMCYIGQRILNSTRQIPVEIYNIKFYDEKYKYIRKDLLFMLMRSQREIGISAGGLRYFNLETFYNIMSGAYSYLTVLRG